MDTGETWRDVLRTEDLPVEGHFGINSYGATQTYKTHPASQVYPNPLKQTQHILFTVSLSSHQFSSLRKFCKIKGSLLGVKNSRANSLFTKLIIKRLHRLKILAGQNRKMTCYSRRYLCSVCLHIFDKLV